MDVLAHCRSEAVRRVDRRAGFVTDLDLRQRDYDEEMWVVVREQLEGAVDALREARRSLEAAASWLVDTERHERMLAARRRVDDALERFGGRLERAVLDMGKEIRRLRDEQKREVS